MKLTDALSAFYWSRYGRQKFNDGTYYAASKIMLEQLGDINVCNITDSQVNKLKQYLLKSRPHATTVTYINMIRTLYNWLIKKGHYDRENPSRKCRKS